MNTSRRSFLKKGAAAVAAASVLSPSIFASIKASETISIQLYSVREDMKNNPLATLKKISGMGYKIVEHANYINRKFYGYSPAEFKKILDDLGLKMLSGHTVLQKDHWDKKNNDFTDAWKYTIEDAAYMGQKFVVSPWLDTSLRKNYDVLTEFMEVFNKSGELCQKHGMKFVYHNHWFEFSSKLGDQDVFDIIMKNTDPDKVVIQLDIGNMYIAGAHAIDVLNKYPGRFETIHVKDMIKKKGGKDKGGEAYESTILGKGLIDPKKVTHLSIKKGGTWLLVIEQESYQKKTPLECVKEDLAVMKSWGY